MYALEVYDDSDTPSGTLSMTLAAPACQHLNNFWVYHKEQLVRESAMRMVVFGWLDGIALAQRTYMMLDPKI